jgi:hypothetical protein
MRAILIALGNPRRRDAGVAQAALRMVGDLPAIESRSLIELGPAVASDIAPFDAVVFLDASPGAKEVRIEAVEEGHALPTPVEEEDRPAATVARARRLFQFAGSAFVCRIPGIDFSSGEGLSRRARASARRAATVLDVLLRKLDAGASNVLTARS